MLYFFSLFFKFYHYVSNQLSWKMIEAHNLINDNNPTTHISKYAQYYHIVPNSQSPDDAVGKPLVHKSATQQTTGNKLFIN